MSEQIWKTLLFVNWAAAVAAYAAHTSGILGFEKAIVLIAILTANMVGAKV